MRTPVPARALAACALVVLSACAERGQPLAPAAPPAEPGAAPLSSALVTCTASLGGTPTVTCGAPDTGGASGALLVGGQGQYLQVSSSNITVQADTIAFDVAVQNLIPQSMGTTDGVTPDADGIRVIFGIGPNATGGMASVANPDGVGDFTGTNQPYFQYDEVLETNETTGTRRWKIQFDPGVTNVTFGVFVMTQVEFPMGWVELSPAADTMVEGGGQLLAATARTVVGNVVPGATISFASSDPGVATVDAAGQVTAIAPGSATITATAGPRSGQATIQVCPDLAVGEVYTASMPLASSLCFAGGASGTAEYTYVPLNLSTSSSLSLTLTGSGTVAVTGPPSPNLIPVVGPRLASAPANDAATVAHLADRARDARETSPLLGRRGARIAAPRAGAPRRAIVPGVPAVGDLWSLNVASGCSGTPDIRTGRVVTMSQKLLVVADTTNPAGSFTTAQYDSIALEFDSIAFAVDSANFGAPTDVDGNGRVVAFFTRAVNELSPPASSVVQYGRFLSRDAFSSDPVNGCSQSNQGEILYMLVPDPTGQVNSNVRTVSLVRGNVTRTLGHELQHLINTFRRVYVTQTTTLEEAWLDEGMSRIAEELMFYRTSVGLAPRGNIVLSSLTQGTNASRRVAAFNTYANVQFTNMRTWLQRPDTTGAFRNEASAISVQGALWGFLRYAADRSGGSEPAFWASLVGSGLAGKANLQNAIGADPDLWLRDYTVAMYTDDAVAGVSSEYTMPSWNFRSLYAQLGGVPHGTRALGNGTPLTLSYRYGGGSAYGRFGVPTGGFATVTALSGGVVPTSPFALAVVRTK